MGLWVELDVTRVILKNDEYFPFTVMVNHFLVSDAKIRKAIERLMEELYSAL